MLNSCCSVTATAASPSAIYAYRGDAAARVGALAASLDPPFSSSNNSPRRSAILKWCVQLLGYIGDRSRFTPTKTKVRLAMRDCISFFSSQPHANPGQGEASMTARAYRTNVVACECRPNSKRELSLPNSDESPRERRRVFSSLPHVRSRFNHAILSRFVQRSAALAHNFLVYAYLTLGSLKEFGLWYSDVSRWPFCSDGILGKSFLLDSTDGTLPRLPWWLDSVV